MQQRGQGANVRARRAAAARGDALAAREGQVGRHGAVSGEGRIRRGRKEGEEEGADLRGGVLSVGRKATVGDSQDNRRVAEPGFPALGVVVDAILQPEEIDQVERGLERFAGAGEGCSFEVFELLHEIHGRRQHRIPYLCSCGRGRGRENAAHERARRVAAAAAAVHGAGGRTKAMVSVRLEEGRQFYLDRAGPFLVRDEHVHVAGTVGVVAVPQLAAHNQRKSTEVSLVLN